MRPDFRQLFRGAEFAALLSPALAGAQQPSAYAHGVVASSSVLASRVGVEIMKRGGNAVDAACAVGLALAVVHPAAGNLGGGGFMLIRLANGQTMSIDYREAAPLSAGRDMYLDSSGNVVPRRSLVGYMASGVPGTVSGLALAHEKYGKLPWRQIVEPAISLATDGFKLSKSLAESLQYSKPLAEFPASRKVFQRDGNYYQAGEVFKQPELAATLGRIAEDGPADFYRGRTAKYIADAMKQDGLITLQDLAKYRAVLRKPLVGSYRGYEVITMPPPSSGGVAVLESLNILEQFDLRADGVDTPETDHVLIEAMRRAFADRSQFLGDPDFVKVPVSGLTAKPYARTLAHTISKDLATSSAQIGHGDPSGYESRETTHFSVVDAAGNAVSNTYTLNFGFGSGVTIPGAGFLMNDEMDDFTSKPGVPNGFGLIQGESNAIAPRKRPLSSMTPTIVTRGGKLYMVIGSPGGPTIITTVLQLILDVVDHGMTISQAVAAPRIHHQWLPDRVEAETGAVPPVVQSALEQMGYLFANRPPGRRNTWGDAEAILVDPHTGLRTGASDPRSPTAGVVGY